MWWTRGGRRRRRGNAMVCMAPMTRTESTGPFLMVSGSSTVRRRGRRLEDDRAQLTGFTGFTGFTDTGSAPPGPCGRARGRDDGRILVTVVSTLRLPVVAEMSRARWPSSPSARSCGCLHRGSNGKAVSKTGEAARSHVPMASASCVARGGWRASRRARSWGRRGSGRRACACAPAACAPVSLSRAAAGPTESCARCMRGCLQSGGHTCGWRVGVPGLEEVGDEVDRGVDRLARALVPRRMYCDGCV